MKKIVIVFMMIFAAMNIFAADDEDLANALLLMKNFKLNVPNCPTLEQVCEKQLTNVSWDNPGGGDQFYCYAKVLGMQSNNEVFSAVFRYDIELKRVEPFSVRIGPKLYVKMNQMQRYLIRFFATESEEVRAIMMRLK